jgi:hypothetical protein
VDRETRAEFLKFCTRAPISINGAYTTAQALLARDRARGKTGVFGGCINHPTTIISAAKMYPKKFTFDPVTVARARMVTLRAPNLDVLLPENRAGMPGIARFLEGGFKTRDKEGRLLLPDLRALANRTVGIFSDYAGEDSTSRYLTYSFLVCSFGSLGPFKQQMAALRKKASIGDKEIAFKDFRMGQIQRMLPPYLRLIDQYVLGLVFTLMVDKSIPSLFGPPGPETLQQLVSGLEEHGYGSVVPKVAEKLFRVVHITAFLIALLGHQRQKIFWMTDNDAIGETPEKHQQLLSILNKVLPLYTTKAFSFLGGVRPFQPRAFEYLDLLSVADVAAGGVAQLFSSIDAVGHDKAQIKEGGNDVLRWLCHDSITLKKLCIIVKRDAKGNVVYGPVNFEARTPIADEVFVPMQLVR